MGQVFSLRGTSVPLLHLAAEARERSGILDGDTVREIQGSLFDHPTPTGVTHPLSGVKLLAPIEPGKILAVGRNYKSHLGTRPHPETPEMFYQPTNSLQNPLRPDRDPCGGDH